MSGTEENLNNVPPVTAPDAFARVQIDKLWERTDILRSDVDQLQFQSKHNKGELERMNRENYERDGRLIGSVTDLVKEVRTVSDRIITLEAHRDATGNVVSQWIPTAIVTILALAQIYGIIIQ